MSTIHIQIILCDDRGRIKTRPFITSDRRFIVYMLSYYRCKSPFLRPLARLYRGIMWHSEFARNMAIYASERIFHKDYLSQAMQELEQSAQEFNGRKTAEMAPVSFRPFHRETLPSHFFDEVIEVDFEFLKIPVMAHYREALAINYGNWQEHVIGASAHGGLFVDTSRPYTEYLAK